MWANPWIILALAHNGGGFWGLGLYKPPVNMGVVWAEKMEQGQGLAHHLGA